MINKQSLVMYRGTTKHSQKKNEGKIGRAITSIYTLDGAPEVEFVDVVWDGEENSNAPAYKPFLNEQIGHPINIENLIEVEEDEVYG